jgi:hypothetical protein
MNLLEAELARAQKAKNWPEVARLNAQILDAAHAVKLHAIT